jgi:hypothetical protein
MKPTIAISHRSWWFLKAITKERDIPVFVEDRDKAVLRPAICYTIIHKTAMKF